MSSNVVATSCLRKTYATALIIVLSLAVVTSRLGAQVAPPVRPNPEVNAGDRLLAPISSYEEKGRGVSAKVTFYPYSLGSSIIFKAETADKSIAPLETQGQLLNVLLSRLFRDHPDISNLNMLLGGNREALLPGLGRALADSKNWDASRGKPLHGQLGTVLITTFNDNEVGGPLAQAFKVHGFSLKLSNVNRIAIDKTGGVGNARLPVHIDDMEFEAVRLPR